MKMIFLLSSCTIIYWIRFHKVIKVTYDRDQDTFRSHFLILPCAALAFVLNNEFTFMEVRNLWQNTSRFRAMPIWILKLLGGAAMNKRGQQALVQPSFVHATGMLIMLSAAIGSAVVAFSSGLRRSCHECMPATDAHWYPLQHCHLHACITCRAAHEPNPESAWGCSKVAKCTSAQTGITHMLLLFLSSMHVPEPGTVEGSNTIGMLQVHYKGLVCCAGSMDFLHLPRSSGHLAPAGAAAADTEH